jgi:hypothetical protein
MELARELEKDVHRINPVLMDLILINQRHENLELTAHGELEIEEDYQDSSPAHQFLHRELQTINSPRNEFPNAKLPFQTDPNEVLSYLNQLIVFISCKLSLTQNTTGQPISSTI